MLGVTLSFLEALGVSPLAPVSNLLGSGLPALNLLFSIVMTYPLAGIYKTYVAHQTVPIKHGFLIMAGLDLAWFNFGFGIHHMLIAVTVFMLTTIIFGPGRNHLLITLVFNMAYLIGGYANTESETYDILWTMPYCVLVLKLIGCSFDIWDGTKPLDKLPEINKKTALQETPTIVELLGFTFFPSAFLVGPQFSMRRYLDMVHGKFPANTNPTSEEAAMRRGGIGLLYLVMFQVGSVFFSQEKLLSAEFDDYSFTYKHIFIGFWGKFLLYKYLACWLLTEASCIRFGLAYDGQEDGKDVWSGCSNVKLSRFEMATKFGHYIDSFNVNTNNWVGKYIFRRLKFLGNKYLSQILSLLFLALWHGLWSGYYMTFVLEYVIMFMEKDLEPMLQNLQVYKKLWSSPIGKAVVFVFLKVYTIVFMGFCLVPFDLKLAAKWWHVYKSLYFSGFVLFFPWAFVYKPLLVYLIKSGILK